MLYVDYYWITHAQTVLDVHLGKIIEGDMKADLSGYAIDQNGSRRFEMLEGKLLVVSSGQGMTPDKVTVFYKSLAHRRHRQDVFDRHFTSAFIERVLHFLRFFDVGDAPSHLVGN